MVDGTEEVEKVDKEALKVKKARDKHLMQMDATKRMYIDEILKKTQYYDDFEYFDEVTGLPQEGTEGLPSGLN